MNQENNIKFNFPTETVNLPSKGLVYSKNNLLSGGIVEIKYMTAREEDILTNINYIKQNIVVEKLLQSLLVTKINIDDLIAEDKDAILIAARILGYGKDYTFKHYSPVTKKEEQITVDLSTLEEKELDESILIEPNKNLFEYIFKTSGNRITFKMLTGHDEKNIERELEGLKKISPNGNSEITTRLKHTIQSVNGEETPSAIREFVDNYLLAKESREFRAYVRDISPGIQMKFNYSTENYTEEGIDIPMTINFLWPEL